MKFTQCLVCPMNPRVESPRRFGRALNVPSLHFSLCSGFTRRICLPCLVGNMAEEVNGFKVDPEIHIKVPTLKPGDEEKLSALRARPCSFSSSSPPPPCPCPRSGKSPLPSNPLDSHKYHIYLFYIILIT